MHIEEQQMQIINRINQISPEMTWTEFTVKFLLSFFIVMPTSMIGITLIVYNLVQGNIDELSAAIATVSGAILGGIIGFILTLIIIQAGHKLPKTPIV
jgi:membrane protein YqaA with SNARE-associated domain